uniref:Transcription factor MYC/MYB N-terminal domain-containing protein n=1 Tax=Rhizophora mucronata TaxID=61149 RepID=A0A2P2KKD5_RHIMU
MFPFMVISQFSDGWQSLFSAGIKTIVVVAVAPYGVIQLGSLNKVSKFLRKLLVIVKTTDDY